MPHPLNHTVQVASIIGIVLCFGGSLRGDENIAPGTATQTTEWNNGQFPADLAIDDDPSTFSHTDSTSLDNQWELRFDEERALSKVEIVARQDCCGGRLTDAVLRIFDGEGESVFDVVIDDPGAGGTASWDLPVGTTGSRVRVGFEDGDRNPQGNTVLHLGEVRVFGPPPPSEALIQSLTVSQTSVSAGESVVISWVTSADAVSLSSVGEVLSVGEVTITANESLWLTLIAQNENATESAHISVTVDGTLLEPVLSEFMAVGDDWVEILNPNPVSISLAGYSLTDQEGVALWPFPEGTVLPANGALVFAAGTPDGIPFGLGSRDGEYLALMKGAEVVSEYRYPRQVASASYGRDVNGDERYFADPTPGKANGFGAEGVVADTKFSVDRGFFEEPFTLEISTATEGAQILATLNGTGPSAENPDAFVYEEPLDISKTTIVRAAAFRDGYLPTNVDTQSFLFFDSVLGQPEAPDGFPTDWGRGPGRQASLPARSDYAMDSRVVSSAPFTDLEGNTFGWKESLTSIPSFSIVMDIDELLDSEDGLYANAANRGRAWEREASLEILDPSGMHVQANCGLRMQGGWNRFPEMLKKSMRLYFRSEYGDSKLQHPIFPDSDVTEFDRLVLRSGNGKAWPSPWRALSGSGNSLPRTTYLRDQFIRDTQKDLGSPLAHGRFAHLYVNGLYWGLYNPAERLDEKHGQAHFGGEESDYDIVKWIRGRGGLQFVAGESDAWSELMTRVRRSQNVLANYEAVLEILDPVNLIDYMITNMYAGNIDWQDNNAYAMRNRGSTGDGKWRFYSWDGEETFLSTSQDSTSQNLRNTATEVYTSLRSNPEFQVLFADRLYRHFFNEGELTPDRAGARWMALASQIDRAIVAESARWGDLMRPSQPYDIDDWTKEIFNIRDNYIGVGKSRHRTATTLSQFTRRGLYPDLAPPLVTPQRGGIVPAGQLIQLENPENQEATIYYTLDGSDPRKVGGEISNTAQTFTGGGTVKPVILGSVDGDPGSTWRYLDTGAELSGTNWTEAAFDDTSWKAGPSQLGYGDRDEQTVVDFGGDPGNKHLTTYFRHSFTLESLASRPEQVLRLRGQMLFDDGIAVYVNGTEIARELLPEGVLTSQTQAVSAGDEKAWAPFGIDGPLPLQVGVNTIAAEIHQISKTNSDISFDLSLDATVVADDGPQGIAIDSATEIKARAFDGTEWSALQSVFFETNSGTGLVISEIYYAPLAAHGNGAEFIELENRSDLPIDLQGLHFTEGVSFTFENGVLEPGERVLVVRDRSTFRSAFPEVDQERIAGTFSIGTALNNGGETITLATTAGTSIATVTYGNSAPWPELASGAGYSLTLRAGTDTTQHRDWRRSVNLGGSPGGSDALPLPEDGDLVMATLGGPVSVVAKGDELLIQVQRVVAADGVQISIEQSSDLIQWQTAVEDEESFDQIIDGGGETQTLEFSTKHSIGLDTYFRVRINLGV